MAKAHVRVRFAPSPTGMMHLGNIRTSLMNYLFAQQKHGTFIIRIEDTDFERNYDPNAKQILADLAWLGLEYQEGPIKGGPHAPYFQSMRTEIYLEKLREFEHKKLVYRCFCSQEELEKKRQRQLALKQPPRYDRACLKLTSEQISQRIAQEMLFIWRFKLPQEESITVHDLSHGAINFDMKSFSDIPLTRQDGSFTFMFANFVDDVLMEITHVLRGEDHLSNTAGQVAMYQAAGIQPPLFWHLPIICNTEGKKLSKRDFGFSLQDLRTAGFLPEAIVNYLAIIGASFEQEIMSRQELAVAMNFEHVGSTSQVKYDVEKLRWLNHKWIARYQIEQLAKLCKPYLESTFESAHSVSQDTLHALIEMIRTDLITLHDVIPALEFYFRPPALSAKMLALNAEMELASIKQFVRKNFPSLEIGSTEFLNAIKKEAYEKSIPLRTVFVVLRIALMGKPNGPSIGDLMTMLGIEETKKRLKTLIDLS